MRIIAIVFIVACLVHVTCGLKGRHSSNQVIDLPDAPSHMEFEQYAGLIPIDSHGSGIFYWLFTSESKPTDPLIFWLNGGPGSSSQFGLFMENGPFSIDTNGKLQIRKYRWNTNAAMVYVDQPIGTGMSVKGHTASHATNRSTLITHWGSFLERFFNKHPQYIHNDMYIAGESYGGVYIPLYAEYMLNSSYPLKGILVGNGYIDGYIYTKSYIQLAYAAGFIDATDIDALNVVLDQCKQGLANVIPDGTYCDDLFTLINDNTCVFATDANCNKTLDDIGTFNVYKYDSYDSKGGNDFPDTTLMTTYLNRRDVQFAIHVGPNFNYQVSSDKVYAALKDDSYISTLPVYDRLLSNVNQYTGLRVLMFNGKDDFICNHIGNEAAILSLTWSGLSGFKAAPRSVWNVDCENAGYYKAYGNLQFLIVNYASHMVSYSQPKRAFIMLHTFITDGQFNLIPQSIKGGVSQLNN
jgi:carboxypeptidase C (cathepsin A)